MVKFMMENMEKVGCPFTKEHLQCMPCDPNRSGGFSPSSGVSFFGLGFFFLSLLEVTFNLWDICNVETCLGLVIKY